MAILDVNAISGRSLVPVNGQNATEVSAAKLLVAEKDPSIVVTGSPVWTFPESANSILLQVLTHPILIGFRSAEVLTEGSSFQLNADGAIHLFVINPRMAIKVAPVAAGNGYAIVQFAQFTIR